VFADLQELTPYYTLVHTTDPIQDPSNGSHWGYQVYCKISREKHQRLFSEDKKFITTNDKTDKGMKQIEEQRRVVDL